MLSNSLSNVSEFSWDMLSFILCGYGVRWINTIACAIFVIFIFSLIFLKNVGWDLEEALFISVIVLLSLPLEWRYSKRDMYAKIIEDHMYFSTLERLIGWSLLIILIGTLSRIMIRY
jgi:hypothetical protein